MNDEIEIIFAPDKFTPQPTHAIDIETIVGEIIMNEHVSPKGTIVFNDEGQPDVKA